MSVGGVSCVPVLQSNSQIICLLPIGQGLNLNAVVFVGSSTSNVLLFSYSPPVIFDVQPTTANSQGGSFVTVTGTSFGTSGFVTIGGASCYATGGITSSGVNQTIICTVPPGMYFMRCTYSPLFIVCNLKSCICCFRQWFEQCSYCHCAWAS